MKNKFFSFLLIMTLAILISCKSDKEDKLSKLTPEQLYSSGMTHLRKQEYKQSVSYFERINQEYPYSPLAANSQLMESYAYYRIRKYEEAIAALDDYINLYPGERNVEYAYYLRALCYYDEIVSIKLDQSITEKAKEALTEVINRFPDSEYARDARFKINLVLDHLAGKEMEIGRFYLKKGDIIAAINRFKLVVDDYQTTTHIEEALYRLTYCYLSLGIESEAKRYAAVLGNNYPDSRWYKYSYDLLKSKDAKIS